MPSAHLPQPPAPLPEGTTTVRQAWIGLLVFAAVALALNAASLHRTAEHLPYGGKRSALLRLTTPVANAATTAGLQRLRDGLRKHLGAPLNAP